MPRAALAAIFLFAGITGCGSDEGEPSSEPASTADAAPDPSIAGEIEGALALENATYGVTAADCSADNRYMNEVVVIDGDELVYQGTARPLQSWDGNDTIVFGGDDGVEERVRIEGDRLIRFPDDPSLRTVYTRCA